MGPINRKRVEIGGRFRGERAPLRLPSFAARVLSDVTAALLPLTPRTTRRVHLSSTNPPSHLRRSANTAPTPKVRSRALEI